MKNSNIKDGIQQFINERQEVVNQEHKENIEFYTNEDSEEGRDWIRAIGNKPYTFNI